MKQRILYCQGASNIYYNTVVFNFDVCRLSYPVDSSTNCSKLVNTDTKGSSESVRLINWVSVLSGLNLNLSLGTKRNVRNNKVSLLSG